MPLFSIQHITKYQYDRPVKESVNEIKIYPYADAQQEILTHDIRSPVIRMYMFLLITGTIKKEALTCYHPIRN